MQRLERDKRLVRHIARGHGDEVDVTPVGLELAERDGALEVQTDQALPEDRLHGGQKAIEQRVDVGVPRRANAQRVNDSKTGRMRSSAVRRLASELA